MRSWCVEVAENVFIQTNSPRNRNQSQSLLTANLNHTHLNTLLTAMKFLTTYTLFTHAAASLSFGLKLSLPDQLNLQAHFAPEPELSTTYSRYMVSEPHTNSTLIYASTWDSVHLSHLVRLPSVTPRSTTRNTSKVASPHLRSGRNESDSSTVLLARRNSSKMSHEDHKKLNDLIVEIQGYATVVLFGVWFLIWLGGRVSSIHIQSQGSSYPSKKATPHIIISVV